ncbi:MAG TPA: hypothetical protein VGD58_03010 [Herpetosiphonaceae bacterium]
MIWIQFAALIVVVGAQLSRYADILAEKTGLGRTWGGGVLLAGATSLPELATGISAVTVVGDVDLAAGGVLGSCLFNLLLLGMLDATSGTTPLMLNIATLASVGHPGGIPLTLGDVADSQDYLIAVYIERRLSQDSASSRYSAAQMQHHLSWLAWHMQQHNHTVFYIEYM